MTPGLPTASHPHLARRFNRLQATALNMTNMVGIGPFITIPLLMSALGGPQAMIGWLIAMLIAIPDGMVWSELGAAMPGSGGSYLYLREAFGRETFGRLMAFLFIWQFIFSGPLEIASGLIGFIQYSGYFLPNLTTLERNLLATGMGLAAIWLLYRKTDAIAKIAVSLWIGTLLTTAAVIVTGALHFDRKLAFDFPPGAFHLSGKFLLSLGAACRFGMYDYLGYYDICYIGDEVKNPGKVIPRSIIISDVTNVVIAEIVVHAEAAGSAQTEEEFAGQMESARRKIKSQLPIEVQRAGDDYRRRREQRADPEAHGDFGDGIGFSIQEPDRGEAHAGGEQVAAKRRQVRQKVAAVLDETDEARGDFERAAENELPDEQKRHQTPKGFPPKRFAQIKIAAAGAGHRRAQFAPDHAVRDGNQHRDQPANHRLRPAERGHQQWDGDERADADHVRHVQRGGLQQVKAARQLGVRCSWQAG